MKYYRYPGEYGTLEAGDVYIEVDEGFVNRQVEIAGSQIVSSNVELIFPEGQINYDEIDQVQACQPQDFEDAWKRNLQRNQDQWTSIKTRFPVGLPVRGVILMYGPAVLVSFGDQILGRLDFQECMAAAHPTISDPIWHSIQAVVSGHDEVNQWLILNAPQIEPDKIAAGLAAVKKLLITWDPLAENSGN